MENEQVEGVLKTLTHLKLHFLEEISHYIHEFSTTKETDMEIGVTITLEAV